MRASRLSTFFRVVSISERRENMDSVIELRELELPKDGVGEPFGGGTEFALAPEIN
jgi:hypothetical protein